MEKHSAARQDTVDNIIWRMRFAPWIMKATDTCSEYVIMIAFSQQTWLCERSPTLLYTYIASLVVCRFVLSPLTPCNTFYTISATYLLYPPPAPDITLPDVTVLRSEVSKF